MSPFPAHLRVFLKVFCCFGFGFLFRCSFTSFLLFASSVPLPLPPYLPKFITAAEYLKMDD